MDEIHIWAVAGGKGGAGRSLLAANLGIVLARAGRRVTLIDLDLQGGDLHELLGIPRPRRSLAGLLGETPAPLASLAMDTSITHLRLIAGVLGTEPPADPLGLLGRVGAGLASLEADQIVLDCGSGRLPACLEAFGLAGVGLVVTTPEPAALEAACRFADAHLRRCFDRALAADTRRALQELLVADGVDPARLSFRALMTRLAGLDPAARDAVGAEAGRTRLELLLNMARDESDEEAAAALVSAYRKGFGMDMPIAGLVPYDPSVLQAIHKRRPLAQQFPNTPATKGILRAADRLGAACSPGSAAPAPEWDDPAHLDHYRVLEIDAKASSKEIQSAYQILKRAFEPDTTPLGTLLDPEALHALQARIEEAYRALIFLESRVAYDRHLLESGRLTPDQVRGLPAEMAAALSASASVANETSAAPPAAPADARDLSPAPAEGAGGESLPAGTAATEPGRTDAGARQEDEGRGPNPAAEGGAIPVAPSAGAPEAVTPAAPDAGPTTAATAAFGGTPAAMPAGRAAPYSGEALRAARLKSGLTLEAIASRTKIRQTYLQALEEERFDVLPPPVFLRGFVREYAACLGLPTDDAARAYLKRRERAIAPADPGADRRSA